MKMERYCNRLAETLGYEPLSARSWVGGGLSMTQSTSRVKELITEVARLRPEELVEFEREWDLLRLRSLLGQAWDEEAAEIAAHFRLPPARQQRLHELLEAQAQAAGRLSPQEEEELDALLQELDRRALEAAQALQELAERRASSRFPSG
jgi:hypothetical protein